MLYADHGMTSPVSAITQLTGSRRWRTLAARLGVRYFSQSAVPVFPVVLSCTLGSSMQNPVKE